MSKTVRVKVTPGAKKELVEKVSDDMFRVAVREEAERNQANIRVQELLARQFAVSVQNVRIVAGHHSRTKRFEINVESVPSLRVYDKHKHQSDQH
ncbi:DUF167 domain-containing protein [Candidatus Wolfebacteria bacterium]|nr:DUF167 domain-containing protein [Candidatus Wolfebacteria bacterium]